jgi:hypothetical protein
VYPNSVVFVCEDRGGWRVPVGTAFLIEHADGGPWRYVVTARHVVEHGRPTWLRLRRRDGAAPEEVRIPEWVSHPTADAAVAPCDLDTSQFQVTFISTESFADRWPYKAAGPPIQPGEPVLLIGLLSDLGSMVDRNIPMVRSGRLGALYQEDIPVRQGATRRKEPCAHLIDAHSRAGFSGAPCVIEHLSIDVPNAQVFPYLAVLGIVVGHFDSYTDVLAKSGEGSDYETNLQVRDNQGVAVVVPVEAVREVLEMEALVENRKQREARAKDQRERGDWENAATLDVVVGRSEFEQFEDLAHKLVNVPKTELDERRKET